MPQCEVATSTSSSACGSRQERQLTIPSLREDVGYVALYSRSDGIVNWRSCLDPHADELVEIGRAHV